jgi:hypothetical protein
VDQRYRADREVARDAAADLEETDAALRLLGPESAFVDRPHAGRALRVLLELVDAPSHGLTRVPVDEIRHVFEAGFDDLEGGDLAVEDSRHEYIRQGRVLPAGDEEGEVPLGGGDHPRIGRIDLIAIGHNALVQQLVEVLVREATLAGALRLLPQLEDRILDGLESLLFRDAGVGDAVEAAALEVLFLLWCQAPPVGDAVIMIVGDKVEQVLFEVRAGAADSVDLLLPDHLCQRNSELGRTHRPGDRDHHLPARVDLSSVGLGGFDYGGGIEVTVVVTEEIADLHESRSAESSKAIPRTRGRGIAAGGSFGAEQDTR